MSWLDQEKVRASRGGLGNATQGAGTAILRQISHTLKYLFIHISIYNTIDGSSRTYLVIRRA